MYNQETFNQSPLFNRFTNKTVFPIDYMIDFQ